MTASAAKPRDPCRQAQLHWNCKQRAFWVVWQRRSKGTLAFCWTWIVAALKGFILLFFLLRVSSSHPPSVWCQGFLGEDDNNGWRTQKGSHPPHWGRSHYLSRHQHDNDIFSHSVNPVKKLKLQRHERLPIWFYLVAVQHFFYYIHSLRELKERLLCLDCLITIRPSATVKLIISFWWEAAVGVVAV